MCSVSMSGRGTAPIPHHARVWRENETSFVDLPAQQFMSDLSARVRESAVRIAASAKHVTIPHEGVQSAARFIAERYDWY